MFRNMQNAEIIRKMTEEFDEVTPPVGVTDTLCCLLLFTDRLLPLIPTGNIFHLGKSPSEHRGVKLDLLSPTGQRGLSSHHAWAHVEEVPLQLLRVHQRFDPPVSVQHHLRRVHDGHGDLAAHRAL